MSADGHRNSDAPHYLPLSPHAYTSASYARQRRPRLPAPASQASSSHIPYARTQGDSAEPAPADIAPQRLRACPNQLLLRSLRHDPTLPWGGIKLSHASPTPVNRKPNHNNLRKAYNIHTTVPFRRLTVAFRLLSTCACQLTAARITNHDYPRSTPAQSGFNARTFQPWGGVPQNITDSQL